MPANPATKVVTGEVRLSYVHLLEPFSGRDDIEPKYSVTIIIPKSDTATLDAIRAAQKAALQDGITTRWGGKKPRGLKSTLHDGDDEDDTDLEKNPEYAGCYYLATSSKSKPGIVDRQLKPLDSSDRVYSGVYARVSMRAFPYSVSGSNGISFGLNNVQILRDGDPFGSVSLPSDDFDAVEGDDFDDDDEFI